MIEFWENKNQGIVKKDLFLEVAEELAKKIKDEKINQKTKNGKKPKEINTPSQIRKFYDEILQFHIRLKADPKKFEFMLPYIKMINSKVAYSYGRDLIGQEFKNFISQCITKIEDQKDFEVFVSFFEAFLGYYLALNKPSTK